ncbi:MAG: AmpG family muropeptide MFS transporter [Oceanicaulis sp.]
MVDAAADERRSFRQSLTSLGARRATAMLVLGFAAGLPILLVFSTLSAWLAVEHVSMTAIGFFAWASLSYSLKFIWAPLVDRIRLPVLEGMLGRRRSWLLVAQVCLIAMIAFTASLNPSETLTLTAFGAVMIAFFSATQDIALDAWRIDVADDQDQALMAAIYQWGYRLGLILAGAGALWIADATNFNTAYLVMALALLAGPLAVFGAPRPPDPQTDAGGIGAVRERTGRGPVGEAVAWLYGAIIAPFMDFVGRYRWLAVFILALIGLYRLTDFVMGFMANPFYLELGYSLTDIANVSKFYGIWVTLVGAFVAGLAANRYGIYPVLLSGAIVGAASNLAFAWLATLNDPGIAELIGAITLENASGGWAGTALIAYMSSLTNRAFSATQYALFSSFYALPGKLFGGLSGAMVESLGFAGFYVVTALIGVPAIVFVIVAMRWRFARTMAKHEPQIS